MNHQTQLCRYTYDPLDRLAISAQSGQPISQCFYQAGQLQGEVQGLAHRLLMRHGDRLLAQRDQREGEIDQQLLGSDRQHSVLMANGRQSQQTMAYSPYGHRPVGSALTQLPGFAGERLDPVTGHYMLGNGYRSFNPVLMRFNSPDSLSPFGEGGFNAYAYCLGDPVNYRDPDGHLPAWAMTLIGAVGGIVLGFATAGIAAPAAAALISAGAMTASTASAAGAVALGASAMMGIGSLFTGLIGQFHEVDEDTQSLLGKVSMGLGLASGLAGGVSGGFLKASKAAILDDLMRAGTNGRQPISSDKLFAVKRKDPLTAAMDNLSDVEEEMVAPVFRSPDAVVRNPGPNSAVLFARNKAAFAIKATRRHPSAPMRPPAAKEVSGEIARKEKIVRRQGWGFYD